jgi:EmrB/QacA subfamily drug resistance transporter
VTGRTSEAGAASAGRAWWTLAALCFALFMVMLDNTIVQVALPSIQRELHTTHETLLWTIDAYVVTLAALILFGGKLGDRFGRKRAFLVGLAIFTLSSAACALATTDLQLVAFRACQGAGAAFLSPLSLSILVAAFSREQLPTAIGIWAGISGIGLSAGPLIGGFLVERFAWSAVFWVNVPIGAIAGVVTLRVVAESRDEQGGRLDVVGTALVTAGLLALVSALIGTSTRAWTSTPTLVLLGTAGALAAAFLAREHRTAGPMVPLRFFLRPAFATATSVGLVVGFALLGTLYLIVLYLQNVQGYAPLEAGVRTLPLSLTQALAAVNAGKLNEKLGARFKLTVGMLLLAGGLLGLAQVHPASSYQAIWPFEVLLGLGAGLATPALSAAGMAAIERNQSGIASGVINASRQVGGALGIAVLGSIAATLARTEWLDALPRLGPAVQAKAAQLTPLVPGGQGNVVRSLAGRPAELAALESFVHGLRGALLTSSALALVGAAVAAIGLRPSSGVRGEIPEATASAETTYDDRAAA